MRKVFVTKSKKKDLWKVIDIKTEELIEEVDDVLLFNATFKRFKEQKGWHGILSETINLDIIHIINKVFYELKFIPKRYYPRYVTDESSQIKTAQFLRLNGSQMFIRGQAFLPEETLKEYTAEYYEEEDAS